MTQQVPLMGPHKSAKVDFGVPVRMRDGTVLYADIFRPDSPGKFPVLLNRTPYDRRQRIRTAIGPEPMSMVSHGYAVVVQDCRGRYGSEGEFNPFFQEVEDGYDSVEWCASQPWSTGKVGMFGASYHGATQWLAAISKPPSLAAIAPRVTASNYYEGWTYQGGALMWGFACSWALSLVSANLETIQRNKEVPQEVIARLLRAADRVDESLRAVPLRDAPGLNREIGRFFYDWLQHPSYDDFWRRISPEEHHHQMTVPALNAGGWFDIFLPGTIKNFVGMRQKGATPQARQPKLVIGPWIHGTFGAMTGDYYFGTGAMLEAIDLPGRWVRWFDRWLKGENNAVDREPPVLLYVMGENVWRSENEWPLARARATDFYFHSGGRANTLNGDGLLTRDSPGASEPADLFLYDPRNPVPTRGGALCCNNNFLPAGSFDQRPIEARPDVLCYTTPPLAEDVEVTGPVTVTLYAASSAPDTDFTAKLVDVCPAPDHCVHGLTDGIVRARYRSGTSLPASLLTSGHPEKFTVDLVATSNVFKKGHSIRVEVSSSNFPRFDRNPNTGRASWEEPELRTASQMVLHTAEHPSRITLPIVPR